MNPIAIVIAGFAICVGVVIAGLAVAAAVRHVDATDEWWDAYQLGRRDAFEQLKLLADADTETTP